MSQPTSEQLEAEIRSGKIGKVYLFDGPELWLKENFVQKIIAAILPKESLDFNLNRYHADSLTGGEVIATAACLPFLADRRVVIVYEAEDISSADEKIIADGIGNLPDTTCLIFLHEGKASLKDEITAQVASHGKIVTFWTPFQNQLQAWITTEVKKRGRTIAWAGAQRIAEACTNLEEISHEIERVILFAGAKKNITLEDVLGAGLPDEAGDFKNFEEAVWHRDLEKALQQGRLLTEVGIRAESIFPVMERIFRNLILGHYYKTKNNWTANEICSALNIKGQMRRELLQAGLQSYSAEELRTGIDRIVRADYENKTGALPGEMALSLLVLNTLRKEDKKLFFC